MYLNVLLGTTAVNCFGRLLMNLFRTWVVGVFYVSERFIGNISSKLFRKTSYELIQNVGCWECFMYLNVLLGTSAVNCFGRLLMNLFRTWVVGVFYVSQRFIGNNSSKLFRRTSYELIQNVGCWSVLCISTFYWEHQQ